MEGNIINYEYSGYQFGNIFLIGEAGGFVSGLSGSGIYSGLISGQEIAKRILNSSYRPKLTFLLASQKFQEGVLDILNLNQASMKYFIKILILYFFFNTIFFNLFRKIFPKK